MPNHLHVRFHIVSHDSPETGVLVRYAIDGNNDRGSDQPNYQTIFNGGRALLVLVHQHHRRVRRTPGRMIRRRSFRTVVLTKD